jgi:hypothetical protein
MSKGKSDVDERVEFECTDFSDLESETICINDDSGFADLCSAIDMAIRTMCNHIVNIGERLTALEVDYYGKETKNSIH